VVDVVDDVVELVVLDVVELVVVELVVLEVVLDVVDEVVVSGGGSGGTQAASAIVPASTSGRPRREMVFFINVSPSARPLTGHLTRGSKPFDPDRHR
jgi:hypothetical protein